MNLSDICCLDNQRKQDSEILALRTIGYHSYIYITSWGCLQIELKDQEREAVIHRYSHNLPGPYQCMSPYRSMTGSECILVGTTKGMHAYPFTGKWIRNAEVGRTIAHMEVINELIVYTREIKQQGEAGSPVPFIAPGRQNLEMAKRLAEQSRASARMSYGQIQDSQYRHIRIPAKYYEIVIAEWPEGGRLRYRTVIDDCIPSNGKFAVSVQDFSISIATFSLCTKTPIIYTYTESGEIIKEYPQTYDVQRQLVHAFDDVDLINSIVQVEDVMYFACSHSLYICKTYSGLLTQIPYTETLKMMVTPAQNVLILNTHSLHLAHYSKDPDIVTLYGIYSFGSNIKITDVCLDESAIVCCGSVITDEVDLSANSVKRRPIMARLVGME